MLFYEPILGFDFLRQNAKCLLNRSELNEKLFCNKNRFFSIFFRSPEVVIPVITKMQISFDKLIANVNSQKMRKPVCKLSAYK